MMRFFNMSYENIDNIKYHINHSLWTLKLPKHPVFAIVFQKVRKKPKFNNSYGVLVKKT